jgi:hypothetical protein
MPKQRQPQRTPLTKVEEIGTHRGRRHLAAHYPSATSEAVWVLTTDDAGHVLDCSCPAWQHWGRCWHAADADNAVVALYKQLHAALTDDQLRVQVEHLLRYLSQPLDDADYDAAENEAVAVSVLRAERARESAA